jgi:hypothetical protein
MAKVQREHSIRALFDQAAHGVFPTKAELDQIAHLYGNDVHDQVVDSAAEIVRLRRDGFNGQARAMAFDHSQAIGEDLAMPEVPRPEDALADDDVAGLAALVPRPGDV